MSRPVAKAYSSLASPRRSGELGLRLSSALRRRAGDLCAVAVSEMPVRASDLVTEVNATARYLERYLGSLGDRLEGRRPICPEDGWSAVMLPSNILASGIRTITDLLVGGNRVLARMTGRASRTAAVIQSVFDDVVPGMVVMERSATGPEFLEHVISSESVRFALVFGGEEVGDDLLRRAQEGAPKRIVFEGPGKDPVIVLEGARLDEVARITAKAKLAAAGQRCVAPENVIVARVLADALVERLVAAFEAACRGESGDPGGVIGPVISPKVPPRVREQLSDAEHKGARIACGGTVDGQRVAPTIVTEVTPVMSVFQDETFAPVLAVASVNGPADAVELARASRFGLTCSVFGGEAEAVGDELRGAPYAHPVECLVFGRYGHVTINQGLPGAIRGPFGGYGKSGWIWDGNGLRQGPKSPALEATLGT
jgi:acyl-CoA reductase-like NAD-dependent aldehyde dehydrogenase